MSRPAFAKPTRSLRCSIEVEPNWVETMSSVGREQQLEVVADVGVDLLLLGGDRDLAVLGPRLRGDVLDDLLDLVPR